MSRMMTVGAPPESFSMPFILQLNKMDTLRTTEGVQSPGSQPERSSLPFSQSPRHGMAGADRIGIDRAEGFHTY